MTEDPVKYGNESTSEKLNKLKARLDAQEEELKRLRSEIEEIEAGHKRLTEEIDSTLSRSEHGREFLAAAYGPYEEEDRVTCEICGRTYLKGECHECPDVD